MTDPQGGSSLIHIQSRLNLLPSTELLAVTLFSCESFASSETYHQNRLQEKKEAADKRI